MNFHLLTAKPEMTDDELTSALSEVSEQRRSVALAYKFRQGRVESLLAYLLLKRLLREHYGIDTNPEFIIGEHGKPVLKGFPGIHFNFSHCKECVACVVSSEGPVGIDVERKRKSLDDGLLNYVFNAQEQQVIKESENPSMEFIRQWTRKEAYVKLTGTGISSGEQLKALFTPANKSLASNPIEFHTEEDTQGNWALTVCVYK